MKRRYPEKSNILLVNITRLGDMLQATPTIAGMKMENPDSKITVLVEKQFEEVCHVIPNIDEVVSLDLGMTCRSIAREQDGIVDAFEYISESVDKLRNKNFDYCLNMSSSAYTALLLRLVGIKRNGGWTSDGEGYRVIESDWARLFATSVFHQNRQYNSLNLVDVFRCSADVEQHPKQLLINVEENSTKHARDLIAQAGFTNTGPLIAIQAGASQGKRQWSPRLFIEFIKLLEQKTKARIILTGSAKERAIIDPILEGCQSANVVTTAGMTSVPQLAALLKECSLMVTGDTGPMHISVAVGTPVVAMFLASAFGFETGPYSEGNLILQPVIACGPCNPNKPCARPDCHDTIEPETLASIVALRLGEDIRSLPPGLVDPQKVIVYRSYFDQYGFCDLQSLNDSTFDGMRVYRDAYRRVWLDDLAGYIMPDSGAKNQPSGKSSGLSLVDPALSGLDEVAQCATQGCILIEELMAAIRDVRAAPARLGQLNSDLGELDRRIEQIGFHHPALGPLTRMFIFAKENMSGSDAPDLASQMGRIYGDLERRSQKLGKYYRQVRAEHL